MNWLSILILSGVALVALLLLLEHIKGEKLKASQNIENMRKGFEQKFANLEGSCPWCHSAKESKLICECGYKYVDGDYCISCNKYHSYNELKNVSSWQDRRGKICTDCDNLSQEREKSLQQYPEVRSSTGIKDRSGMKKYILINKKSGASVQSTEEYLQSWIARGFEIVTEKDNDK